jgi:hypothetical protein
MSGSALSAGAIRSMRRWRNDNDDAPCHRCQHPTLNEIPFVFAHADGTMIPLNPSACPQHDLKYLVLERGLRNDGGAKWMAVVMQL